MKQRVITFNYILKDQAGQVLDSSQDGTFSMLEGAGQIIPALERQLALLQVGDKRNIKLVADEAYGQFEEAMIIDVPKEEVAHLNVQVGGFLQLQMQDQSRVVRVTKITDETVTLDGNHPLAGQDLEFDVEMVGFRDATDEEISHGHVHGPHGHSH